MSAHEETLARLRTALGDLDVREVEERDGMPCLETTPDVLHPVLTALRLAAGFESITLVTGVDRLQPETGRVRGPRFEVIHQLHSLEHGDRVRVRTHLDDEQPCAPSCTDLWPGVSFMERECYDMFGIVFTGHPDLRRLLMPEEYGHHPLRKEFPHQGIEPDRLYREWDARRREQWDPEEVS